MPDIEEETPRQKKNRKAREYMRRIREEEKKLNIGTQRRIAKRGVSYEDENRFIGINDLYFMFYPKNPPRLEGNSTIYQEKHIVHQSSSIYSLPSIGSTLSGSSYSSDFSFPKKYGNTE